MVGLQETNFARKISTSYKLMGSWVCEIPWVAKFGSDLQNVLERYEMRQKFILQKLKYKNCISDIAVDLVILVIFKR